MTIAIDGYSSCGKSTLAKALAKKMNFVYVDSGAMYRAVTYYFLKNDIDPNNKEDVICALEDIDIDFREDNNCYLNGVNIEREIRSMRISNNVSEVATIKEVREKMVHYQRSLAASKSIVMDGRDIGTVVFPDAEVKFFVTADKKIRAQRRYEELIQKGRIVTLNEVVKNLEHRDHIDTTRDISPLKQADDAILIDNSCLNRTEQLEMALEIINEVKEKI